MRLSFKRLCAYLIDNAVILLYALVLFGVTMGLVSLGSVSSIQRGPIEGQLIGLFTLTIPIVVAFTWMELRNGQTPGKRLMKLRVSNASWMRNVLKFLPWELAHLGVHWMYDYANQDMDAPLWVWMVVGTSELLVLIYGLSVLLSGGRLSLYDRVVGAEVGEV
ncbi:RDD family protein [Marinoscillum sp.]|uniref:RDD family protein n=1 Tax=Marinoscillum sp. TaxID=2024838 RepID=UPI003BAD8182